MSGTRQFCTFRIADLFVGIDVHHVQEILKFQPTTRVPRAPRAVSGLINLRGQIVTTIDLRCRLDLPPRQDGQPPMNVVVRDYDNAVSLLVDRIGEVLEVADDLREPPPATVDAHLRPLILGTYKLPDQLLLVLDHERLLTLDDSTTNERRSAG